ncbi:tetratricopeptide repeat protein [Luteimonas sp. MC1572]|uniref:tetratricopeptide repeat protein n=1 Tax=Luteimonas sp. MC1572 TaxID=2799325 RepID=UPI0018F0FAA1|nr:tetratricopeptide repeat protein [Luteimonas sp. MC1572]MBJ6981933.1 tetratricopeptide repeat protein [Luteimonas sp. MC1572]QQO03208.1 tetratricopeptide repeat protein [Luteimonas sp. MC1572]
MSVSNSSRLLTTAIAAALLVMTVGDANAQRANDRRARAEAAKATAEEPANLFPGATRQEPTLAASQRIGPRLNKLSDAQQAGDVAAAQVIADEILANEKANAYERAITMRLMADLYLDTDAERSKDYLRKAIELNGLKNNDHYGSMVTLAQLQLQDDDYAGALATLDRLIAETKTTDPTYQVIRGNSLYRLERFDEAIAALKPVVEGNPEARPDWVQLLMASYAESGRSEEAARLAEEIAAKAPGDKRAQLNLANIYLQSDDIPRALEVYERLRKAGELTEERDYRNLMALYLNSEGKEREAAAVITEGLDKQILKPDHQTYNALAQAYYFSEQYDESIKAYQKAAPLAPDGETWLNLAKVLANEGRSAESKDAAQKALDKGIKRPDEARALLKR